jgi:pyruvate formate lyase activating enzyme
VLSFLSKRKGLLDGVCVTGGEPLLQPDLPHFLRRIKEMGFAVKLDTNGANPAALKALVGEGLVDYVAMDIKNAPDRYAETVGIPAFDVTPIAESVAFLLSDAVDYEFRTTVVKEFHRVEDIEAAARFISGAKRYFLQNFEDSGDLIQTGLSAVSPETLDAMQAAATPYIQYIGVRGI